MSIGDKIERYNNLVGELRTLSLENVNDPSLELVRAMDILTYKIRVLKDDIMNYGGGHIWEFTVKKGNEVYEYYSSAEEELEAIFMLKLLHGNSCEIVSSNKLVLNQLKTKT